MRVFISVYPGFTLAIPMDAVASMVLYNQKTEKTVQYDPKNRSTYVSLPWLFNMPDQEVPHGVVMREWNTKENKVVLLTAEVKRDIEIPDEEFYPIPKALGALRFSAMFSGIKFSDNPILLLNVEQLFHVIQNEQWVNKKPSPPVPAAAVSEPSPAPPPSPAAVSEPSPPPPDKIVEEPPKSPALASEASSLTIDKILEVCGVIEKPSISPAVALEPSLPTPNEKIDERNEVIEEQSEVINEQSEEIEVCEIIDEPPIDLTVISEASLQTHIEVCEAIDESPISLVANSEAFALTFAPQPGQGDEFPALNEIIELCEID